MAMQAGPMLTRRSPLAAYRDDLAKLGDRDAFGESDATWLTVATILHHGVDTPADSRPPLLATLREVVGSDPALSPALTVVDCDPPTEFELDAVSPIVRAVVERMEDDGALSLAYSTLAILADADLRLSVLERGRVLAQLGRVAWKEGALDTAREQYRRVEILGRAASSAELRARAWLGYGIVAQLRGNYPEVRKWSARAADQADRAGLAAVGSIAYHNLMVSAAVAGDFNGALGYGWRAYQGSIGDAACEAEALLNLSELLLRSGHADSAIRGFTAVLDRRPRARIALPALGGVAKAASVLGDDIGVRAARLRAERWMASSGLPYQSAALLLELSEALARIGDFADAKSCRARALEIAERHAYHEIAHRLAELDIVLEPSRPEVPHALDPQGTEVARAVASLDLVGSGSGRSLADG
jgi:tetratricopeptide (TPR) repeat protein